MYRLRRSEQAASGIWPAKRSILKPNEYRFLSTLSSLAQACSDALDLRQYKTAKRSSAKYVLRFFAP